MERSKKEEASEECGEEKKNLRVGVGTGSGGKWSERLFFFFGL
jgi:hypothetical protein